MSASLALEINEQIKAAMRAHDSLRLGTLRLLQAAIKQKTIDERIEPDDAAILAIIEKQVKQRRESISAFESAGRQDSAAQERAEMQILQEFLPAQASAEEINAAISAALDGLGAQGISGPASMGPIMAQLKKSLGGKADMAKVSALVRAKLG